MITPGRKRRIQALTFRGCQMAHGTVHAEIRQRAKIGNDLDAHGVL